MRLINFLIILRILSTILLIEAITFLFCLPVGLVYNENVLPFVWSFLISAIIFLFFRFLSRKVNLSDISSRDTYLAVTLSWLIFSLLGTLPYILTDVVPFFVDAFFESASGFTTTGSSILTDLEILPKSIIFYRSLTNWIGGIGIIVLVIIILPSLKVLGYQLLSLESSIKEKIHPKAKAVGFRLLFIYLGMTVTEIFLLTLGDMSIFESICHSFATVATGGFSTRDASISGYSPYSQYIIILFMFLGGVSYVVYYYIVKLKYSKIKRNEELWFYAATVVTVGILIFIILLFQTSLPFESAFRHSFFQTVSFLTTTGFTSADYLSWPQPAIIILFLLLFTGACSGSSTGNIKMARHLIVIKNIKSVFKKLLHPSALPQIKLNGNLLNEKTNVSVLSFVVLYLFIFIVGTGIIATTGVDPVTSASAVAASLGNVGPGLGSVGPLFNYAHLPSVSKIILSIMMILGRLEIFTMFILTGRSFWKL